VRPGLEALIAERFEKLADDPMFPLTIAPDAFELQAALEWLGELRGRLVLDVGCAKGRIVKALSDRGARMVGADPVWKLLKPASSSVPEASFVRSSITHLPFLASSCDGIVCVEVIEHVPDLEPALAELARVLKPGGRAIIIDKNLLGIGFSRFWPNWLYKPIMERLGRWFYPRDFPFRERWYAAPSMRRRLQTHFSIVEIRYLDGRVKGLRRTVLAPLFTLIPASRPDVAWCCIK
jgi:malonyl-CoA O-methyltransferase